MVRKKCSRYCRLFLISGLISACELSLGPSTLEVMPRDLIGEPADGRLSIHRSTKTSVELTHDSGVFLSQFRGTHDVRVQIYEGLDGEVLIVKKAFSAPFSIVLTAALGQHFQTGDTTLTLSGPYASVTLIYDYGSSDRWYEVASKGTVVYSTP